MFCSSSLNLNSPPLLHNVTVLTGVASSSTYKTLTLSCSIIGAAPICSNFTVLHFPLPINDSPLHAKLSFTPRFTDSSRLTLIPRLDPRPPALAPPSFFIAFPLPCSDFRNQQTLYFRVPEQAPNRICVTPASPSSGLHNLRSCVLCSLWRLGLRRHLLFTSSLDRLRTAGWSTEIAMVWWNVETKI